MFSLKQKLAPYVHKSVLLTTLWFLLDNFLATIGIKNPGPPEQEHLSGAAIDADISYSSNVVESYAAHSPIYGRVAEIGPGGSAATALLLIDRGAEAVELLDRFDYPHNLDNLTRAYEAIISRSPRLRSMFASALDLSARISFTTGERAAAERYFRVNRGYNAIFSCAVLEHLFDPLEALTYMFEALEQGATMVHYIDLRDHAMYTAGGLHELTFLTIPDWIYPLMSRRRGRPNRVLTYQYRELAEMLGFEFEILVTSLVGVGLVEHRRYQDIPWELRQKAERRVEQIRHRLIPRYRRMPAADLAVDSIALIATKRGILQV